MGIVSAVVASARWMGLLWTPVVPRGICDPATGELMRLCRCGGVLHRSRARNVVERLRRDRSLKRPYRCDACGRRAWFDVLLYSVVEQEPVREPDLSTLDAVSPAPKPRPLNLPDQW